MRLTSSCLDYMILSPYLLPKHVFSSLNDLEWSQRLQIKEPTLSWSPTLPSYLLQSQKLPLPSSGQYCLSPGLANPMWLWSLAPLFPPLRGTEK